MPDELLPNVSEETTGSDPQGEKKSGMFRPVGEELPIVSDDSDDGDTHIVVVEATSTSWQPVVTTAPDTIPAQQDLPTIVPEVESLIEQMPSVDIPLMQEVVSEPDPVPQVEVAPVVQEVVPELDTVPVVQNEIVSEVVSAPHPLAGSGMWDPNTPTIVPPTIATPIIAPATHTGSRKRILLLLIFLGALGFLGYKYRFVAPPEVVPELPVDANTLPAGTWVEDTLVATGAQEATGEVTSTWVAGTVVVPSADGLQTFDVDAKRSGLQLVTFQYPQWRTLAFVEIETAHVIEILNEKAVLQARIVAFWTTDFDLEYTLVKDALDTIKLSEKPFLNESFVGAIGIYSGVLLEDPLPGGNYLASLAQPIISFQDKKNQTNYIVILQPNMDKQVFTILRSLRLP